MDGPFFLGLDRTRLVDGLAHNVNDAAERFVANRHRDRLTGVGDFLAAHQSFGRVHRDRADRRLPEMLRDFQHQTVSAVFRLKCVQDRRQVILELHVDDCADDLRNFSDGIGCGHNCPRYGN